MDAHLAIISDVHGNATAFEAVLNDIADRGIPTVVNLGDVIGYGPEPEHCLDLARDRCAYNLCGNHEYAVMHGAEGFNPVARGAVEFVRERLSPEDEDDQVRQGRWTFLQSLPSRYEQNGFLACHGSPRHHVMEYVLPSDPEVDPLKIDDIFEAMTSQVAFVGHTHFPGVVEEGSEAFLTVQALQGSYTVEPDRKAIVNVGSVGQPRDRDVRSCYVEVQGGAVHFRRVEYDIETTVRKIRESGRLHDSLGHRLLEGR